MTTCMIPSGPQQGSDISGGWVCKLFITQGLWIFYKRTFSSTYSLSLSSPLNHLPSLCSCAMARNMRSLPSYYRHSVSEAEMDACVCSWRPVTQFLLVYSLHSLIRHWRDDGSVRLVKIPQLQCLSSFGLNKLGHWSCSILTNPALWLIFLWWGNVGLKNVDALTFHASTTHSIAQGFTLFIWLIFIWCNFVTV